MIAALTLWGLPILGLAGMAFAVLVVWVLARVAGNDAWTTVGRLFSPPAALGRALMPLLVVTAVVALFATEAVGPFSQLVCGVVLAGLVWLLVHGQGVDLKHERQQVQELRIALHPAKPTPALKTFVLPAIVTAAAAAPFVVAAFGGAFATWRSTAGWSGVLEFAALGLVAVAGVLRLAGYATGRWRLLVAAVVVVFAIRTLTAAGVLGGEDGWNDAYVTPRNALVGLVVLLVVAFAFEAHRLQGLPASPPSTSHQLTRALGLVLAFVAAILLAVALGAASLDTTAGPDKLPSDDFGPIVATAAPKILDAPGGPDEDLAWTFAPVLHLQHDEDYPPVSVEDFLSHSTQAGAGPKTAATPEGQLSLATLPTTCSDSRDIACGTISCPTCIDRKKESQPEGFVPQGVFYARVARKSREPRVFSGWLPEDMRGLSVLIQYWLFYDYDSWQAETVIGGLTQEHEADWENVSVGLDGANKPLFVALSAHCAGQLVRWSRIATAPGRLVDGKLVVTPARVTRDEEVTHPIVAVARGSHANYAVSAGHRPPDWGSCKHLPSDALSALSYASNVRDLTETGDQGWFAYPRDIAVVTARTKPMSYPGSWGDGETITFGHRAPTRTARGPLSPPLQRGSWDAPIRSYFCGAHWRGDEHGTPSECHSAA